MPVTFNLNTTNPIVVESVLDTTIAEAAPVWVAVDELDFTTVEPGHVDGNYYINTVTGVGNITTGTTFTEKYLYRSNGTTWEEIIPTEGKEFINQTTNQTKRFDGTDWILQVVAISTNYVDSSAGVIDIPLGAATGSQNVVLWTNQDVTSNAATFSVPVGESINGVVDGVFTASNYADGTQFRFDDLNTGEWVTTVVGASQQTALAKAKISQSGTQSIAASTTVVHTYNTVDHDDYGFADLGGNQLVVPVGYDGDYVIKAQISQDSGTSNAGYGAAVRVNGTSVAFSKISSGVNEGQRFNIVSSIVSLVAGDTISSSMFQTTSSAKDRTGGSNQNWLSIEQVPNKEAVLAGMVTPTDLEWTQLSLSADTVGVADGTFFRVPFDNTVRSSGSLAVSNGKVTLKAGRTYEISGFVQTATGFTIRVVDFTNDTPLSPTVIGIDSGDLAGNLETIYTPLTDVEVGLGTDGTETFQGGALGAAVGVCSMLVKELPTSTVTVLDPTFTEAKALHYGGATMLANTVTAANIDLPFDTAMGESFGLTVDLANNKIVIAQDGKYLVRAEAHTGTGFPVLNVMVNGVVSSITDKSLSNATDDRASASAIGILTLTTGDELTIQNTSTINYVGSLFVQQQPDTQYVTPSDVPVEDVHDTIFTRVTGLTGTAIQTLDGGVTWNTIKSTYESIRIYAELTDGNTIQQSVDVPVAAIVENYGVYLTNDSDSTLQLTFGALTGGDITPAVATLVDYGIEIIGVKAQKTVINTTDMAVNDQAASGYMDFGTMRMQWGTGTAGTPIVFPVVFGAAPNLTATVEGSSSDRIVARGVTTTTGCTVTSFNTGTNAASSGESFDWQAIGLKP